ncbi:MAG TPA: hypothetical protein DHW02_19340 [Ktedonobacter sp.]|nr:hypothetical protein [Ktedonobacter sp.]
MELDDNNAQPTIVGSAEPLSREETQKRLQDLKAWGVDLTLVQASLSRTPTERAERMIGLLKLAKGLRRAYIKTQH